MLAVQLLNHQITNYYAPPLANYQTPNQVLAAH